MADENISNSHAPVKRRHRRSTLLVATALGASLLALPILYQGGGLSAQQIQPAAQPLGAQIEAPARAAPMSFAGIVKKVRPAVVSVKVKIEGPKIASRERPNDPNVLPFNNLPKDHPFNEFFRRFFGEPGAPDGFRGPRGPRPFGMAQGSGFFISEDGYAVTNNHVVDKATQVEVTLDDGSTYDADIIGTDEKTDLALLKVKADREFPYVAFTSNDIEIGDWVVAVGNPFGLGGTVTAGIVSARGRDIGSGPYDDFIQIDASMNKGNSGGPAFNLDGEVVGVNTAIFSPSGGSVGIGFAIPANVARDVIDQLKENGAVTRGWLGVQIQSVTPGIAESLGLDEAKGAIVAEVQPNSPAQKSGLREGDTILKVDGRTVEDAKDLARKIGNLKPNTATPLNVMRDGRELTLKVVLGTQPASEQQADAAPTPAPAAEETKVAELGLELAAANEVAGAGDRGAVVVGVEDDSEAAAKGLQVGDVILKVGGEDVTDPQDVAEGLKRAAKLNRKAVLLWVQSGDRRQFVSLSVKKS
jgi:serine protease Do